jgi:Domain of unknown function (DUF4034)
MKSRIIFYTLFGSACLWAYLWIKEREQNQGLDAPAARASFTKGMAGSKEKLVEQAWGLMASGQHEACVKFVDEEFAKLEPAAREQEATLRCFPAMSDSYKWHELDGAGNLLRVKQESLLRRGMTDEAMAVREKMFREFTYFQSWRAFPEKWHPARDARLQWQRETMLRAIRKRDLDHYAYAADTIFDTEIRNRMVNQVTSALLDSGDYDSLDYAAEYFSSNPKWQTLPKSRFLGQLFVIEEDEKTTDKDLLQCKAQIEKWIANKPESKAASLMLAEFWISYAWHARGGGWAQEVSQEGWRKFGERIHESHVALDKAPKDIPVWYSLRLIVARAESEERDETERLFNEGLKRFPWHEGLLSEFLVYLLPRWHGEPGDWQAFTKRVGQELGPVAYLEVIAIAARHENLLHVLPDKSIDWDLLKKGFESRIVDDLGNITLPQLYAAYAWVRKDKAAAKHAFSLCGDKPILGCFDTPEGLDDVRRWANQ